MLIKMMYNSVSLVGGKNGNQLCLADIVSDIMHVQKEEVDEYLKLMHQQTNDNNNLEIL